MLYSTFPDSGVRFRTVDYYTYLNYLVYCYDDLNQYMLP